MKRSSPAEERDQGEQVQQPAEVPIMQPTHAERDVRDEGPQPVDSEQQEREGGAEPHLAGHRVHATDPENDEHGEEDEIDDAVEEAEPPVLTPARSTTEGCIFAEEALHGLIEIRAVERLLHRDLP
ncbi:MAG: hypothetical protein L0J68_10900, partial [Micrococcaceae bacterium]|nr:hypothetical protein [Micrococcaceae bacterium]